MGIAGIHINDDIFAWCGNTHEDNGSSHDLEKLLWCFHILVFITRCAIYPPVVARPTPSTSFSSSLFFWQTKSTLKIFFSYVCLLKTMANSFFDPYFGNTRKRRELQRLWKVFKLSFLIRILSCVCDDVSIAVHTRSSQRARENSVSGQITTCCWVLLYDIPITADMHTAYTQGRGWICEITPTMPRSMMTVEL